MSKIGDELRGFTNTYDLNSLQIYELKRIADRIDAEHERAMAAAALITGVPITDENMAEHGWVKLPVDADGVTWTGEEHFFRDAQVGGARFLFGLSYFGDGKWEIIDHYQNEVGAAPAMCRHVPDVTADQHAELAAGLMDLSTRVADMDAYSVGKELREFADRLREMVDADADAKR